MPAPVRSVPARRARNRRAEDHRPGAGGEGGATVPIGHDHVVGRFDAGHCQACAREAGLLDHYQRVQREETRLRQAHQWAWTARRWAGWALLVGAVGVVLALVDLLTG
jgi:hypothetical protein